MDFMRRMRKILHTVLGHKHIVFRPHATIIREIKSRFNRKNHPGFQNGFIPDNDTWTFMNLQTNAMSQSAKCIIIQIFPQKYSTVCILDIFCHNSRTDCSNRFIL